MEKVVVLKIEAYDVDLIKNKLRKALAAHFSLDAVSVSKEVVLKPNLLMPVTPQTAIITHPVVTRAVGEIFKEKGYEVAIADNPSAFQTQHSIESVYDQTGYKEMAQRCNLKLLYPERSIQDKNGIPFSWWAKERAVINIPKLKTHNLTVISAATKNLYGCISGTYKSYLHQKFPKTKDFVQVLLTVYESVKPQLTVVDAIVALEGEGPARKGKPKQSGFIAIGDDALAVDYTLSTLIGMGEKENPLIEAAKEKGILNPEKIEIISELATDEKNKLEMPPVFFLNRLPDFVARVLSAALTMRPFIEKHVCTACGDCIKVCSNDAIIEKNDKMEIDYKKCIFCMCCNEVCRYNAVVIKKSPLLKVVEKL